MKSALGKFVKYVLPLLLSIGLCYILYRDIDVKEMYDFIVSNCDFKWMLMSMGLGAFAYWIRGIRWRLQLIPLGIDPPARIMYYAIAGTYAVNLVLPRLGELWRCEYIARRQKASFASVLGSMVSERLADTITVLLMLLATVIWAGSAVDSFVEAYPEMFQKISYTFSSPHTYIIIVAVVFVIWLIFKLNKHRTWVIKIKQQLHSLAQGFTAIFHMRKAWLWGILTVVLWGTYLLQMILCFKAFTPTREYMELHGPLVALVSFVLASLSMAVPSNGGIGPYQIALGFGIHCFLINLTIEQCYSFATLVLAASMVVTILCGLFSFIAIAIDNRQRSRTTD